ncbi:cellulase family glycosylhydrolase [Actinocrinis puniceicyclus]|uniref:Cellulase family glycosylhydrolase n=1 Tax=Actinocrinis puniceicyclus TaxID=977794 RepID=A0A8J7WJ98_9ACTN|nr:cellulase family glycosylhydrolase [Actinocrinis puniceicyclus]MBS2961940.1 cellulase family glycosylhydrolase [Actinocrinis puniceicyclus]
MQRPSLRLPGEPGSSPAPWIGANFWSRRGGPLMWRRFDADTVRAELRVLREHGLTFTRSFFYWPDFMPEPNTLDQECCARYEEFLDLHTELGMYTIPTLIVGHMSGENWDPAWRGGRDLYGDVWMVAQQAWFGGQMARRYAAHPAVAGWLVSNEMPIYGGPGAREQVASWAQLIIDAVRAGGGSQPISLGDGAWGLEITGLDNGFRLRDIARLCDFIGPHSYPMGDDPVRQHYTAAWICELSGSFGRPVILEEFGLTSDFASDANGAHYYRQALHNSLLAGATGWGAWNNTDFDGLEDQDPYRHHPFELHFGLTDAAGRPKPQLAELRAFADVLARVDFPRLRRTAADTAMVVSSFLDTEHPFTEPEKDGPHVFDTLRQAYVSARLADLPVALARESDGIGSDAKLYLVPSTKHLLSPTWYQLEDLARGGATVYVSYSAGAHFNQRGPWHAAMNKMFGFEHQLMYGLVDPVSQDEFEFEFVRPFGPLGEGSRLRFRTGGNEHSRAMLPVRPTEAEVLAVDGQGRPALLSRRVGAGAMVFCTYGIEHMAASLPRVNPEPTRDLYEALAEFAGVTRAVTADDPRVAVDVLVHEDGTRYVWFVSQAAEELTVKPVVRDGGKLAEDTVSLPPFGVRVLKLEG